MSAGMRYNSPNEREWDGAASTARPVASERVRSRMRAKSIPHLTPKQQDRFWARVEVHHPAGCWEWIGPRGTRGYGQLFLNDKCFTAHRVAYALLIEDAPGDMTIDHLCRNKRCVNPDHLRVVTSVENVLAGLAPTAQNARKTHCINGHEFTPDNVYQRPNRPTERGCRACRRTLERDRKRLRRAERMVAV